MQIHRTQSRKPYPLRQRGPYNTVATYNADDSIRTLDDGSGAGAQTYTYAAFGGLNDDRCHNYSYDGFDRLWGGKSPSNTKRRGEQPATGILADAQRLVRGVFSLFRPRRNLAGL